MEKVSLNKEFLLNEEDLLFFRRYEHGVVSELSLNLKTTPRQRELLQQISRKQKIETKIPVFFESDQVHYPEVISLEQCSSEATANFKSSLFSGGTILDLSAGMGVDSLLFSRHFQRTILVEPNQSLAEITSHNLKALAPSADIFIEKGKTASEFLEKFSEKVDLIYLDPSRRNEVGDKVFRLQDCEPNAILIMPQLMEISNYVLIKTSPLLDITLVCESIPYVKNVYVLSINNECKELLFHIEKNHSSDYQIHAVDLSRRTQISFFSKDEWHYDAENSLPLQYLFEPDASLLKAGAFNVIQQKYQVFKLHQHSHLYTSSAMIANFQGRAFVIDAIVKPDKKEIHKYLINGQANLTIRNFPGTVAALRKKWQIKEGGSQYLFATTLCDGSKVVIFCTKC